MDFGGFSFLYLYKQSFSGDRLRARGHSCFQVIYTKLYYKNNISNELVSTMHFTNSNTLINTRTVKNIQFSEPSLLALVISINICCTGLLMFKNRIENINYHFMGELKKSDYSKIIGTLYIVLYPPLNLSIPVTPKCALWQAGKTHLKCRMVRHFIKVYTVFLCKTLFRVRNSILFENKTPVTLKFYDGPSKRTIVSNKKE